MAIIGFKWRRWDQRNGYQGKGHTGPWKIKANTISVKVTYCGYNKFIQIFLALFANSANPEESVTDF